MRHNERNDFQDSGAAWESLKTRMRQANEPLLAASAKLVDAGMAGSIVPLSWGPPALLLLVGTRSELRKALCSTDDTRSAFVRGRHLPVDTASLRDSVMQALGAAGGAASLMLPLRDSNPTVYVVAGDVAEVSRLVDA